ncbi:adenylylsulfatase HINT3 isoform X2 [Macadamia integrifolia]|uniref:adenylylsulfatase HINT3 isoform X2 n=1 Tax=Macadamia integrifolia TaxID=60698 RepID=UPI001C4F971E|nr:adenylylsulfatase HINT3 isoform X2 [Macadamia integrifolia]
METRRLAVLCSHLRQVDSGSSISTSTSTKWPRSTCISQVSTSNCVATLGDRRIQDSKKVNEEKDCIFCRIIVGDSPAFKLYEDDTCLCILDLNPLSHGHSLIIPKAHFSSLETTPPSVVGAMCSKVPFISNAIMRATQCDSFNLIVNSGAAAGQVIFHTHLHIIPRKARDQLWKSESFRRKPLKLDEEVTQLADLIQKLLRFADDKSKAGNTE